MKNIQELKSDIKHVRQLMKERNERISEGQTDMNDCFVSQRMNELSIQVLQEKIRILEQDGLDEFEVLQDAETNEVVSEKLIDGKYGLCFLIKDEYQEKFGKFVGVASRESTYLNKGLKSATAMLPAWVTTKANGKGMAGAYSSSVVVFQSDFNHAN